MKRKLKLVQSGMACILMATSTFVRAQLPTDFITKVSYHEKKEVVYSMPSEVDLQCLTLAELSQFHNYMQSYTINEYVDLEGDLLSDKRIVDEQNVRDEWMEDFSRITVGKHSVNVYAEDGTLFHQSPREQDSNTVYLTQEQAEEYGKLVLDQEFYEDLILQLVNAGLSVVEENNLVVASNDFVTFSYNHSAKTISSTEYDSTGTKVKESLVEYGLNYEGDNYYPKTEVIYEWILTDSGCCVRKVTTIERYGYEREVYSAISEARKEKKPRINPLVTPIDHTAFEIVTESARDVFRVQSTKPSTNQLEIVVYDMAGREVLKTNAREGEAIQLPVTARKGIYLVHIVTKNSKFPIVGKVIKASSYQF